MATDLMPPIDEDMPELRPGPNGQGQMMPTETKVGDIVSMRRAAVLMPRQPAEIRRQIAEMAEMFGDAWEYRFPVRNSRTGQTEFIEGPTIGCTMVIARAYGNCDVAHTRTEDDVNSWVLYSTFVDLQSGFSLTRGFRQRKGQSRMGGDRSRGEDIDFQIGVSKSTRNVVARALDDFVQYARARARERLAGSIAKRPDEYRERISAYLSEVGYPLAAIEGAVGAKLKAWTPEQIASVVRTLTAHKDGILADLADVYQPKGKGADATEATPQDATRPATAAPGRAREPEHIPEPPGEPVAPTSMPARRSPGRPKKAETVAREQALRAREIIAVIGSTDHEYVNDVLDERAAEISELSAPWQDEVREAARKREAETGELPADPDDSALLDQDERADDDYERWLQNMSAVMATERREFLVGRKNQFLQSQPYGERGAAAVEAAFQARDESSQA